MSDTTSSPFQSALNDPFAPVGVSNLQQPGLFGVSPDVWRSLAGFGANMAASANARDPRGFLTYGTGFAGPFGAAIAQSQQQGLERGTRLSDMDYRRSLAQGQQIQNYMNLTQLPLAQAKLGMALQFYNDPQGFMQKLQGIMGPQPFGGAQPQQSSGGVPFAANNPLNMRFAGQDGAANTNGFAAFPTPEAGQAATDKQFGLYADKGINTLRGLISRWAPPSENNTDAYIASVSRDTGIHPDAPIDLNNRDTIRPIQAAMAKVEGNKNATVPPFQVAQAGNGPLPMPGGGAQQPTQLAPQQPQAGAQPNANAMAMAQQYEQQANQLELMHSFGLPIPGDPAMLRQAAQKWREVGLAGVEAGNRANATNQSDLQYKPQIAAQTKQAEAPYNLTPVRPGGIIFNGTGQPIGSAPMQSNEVITSGPNAGTQGTVLRDPRTNQIISGNVQSGEGAQSGIPGGFIPTHLSPAQEGRLKAQGEVEQQDLQHDRKIVEEDLANTIDTVIPAKQQLMQLRALVDSADTGAAGQFRNDFKNWVQTFAPDFASKIVGDAAPGQEFDKIALMGAGKQERGDLGARGGFRAIEMYRNANPSMDKQPTANHDMANALLISHQFHEDYATGASDFYNKNRSSFLTPGQPGEYKPISTYDQQFVKTMRPELYASAISAINGKPYAEWSKNLSNKQIQIVGGILQRADPSAVIDINGHQVPVASFKTVVDPTQIGMTGGGGAG